MTTATLLYFAGALCFMFGVALFVREYRKDSRKAAVLAHMEKACAACKLGGFATGGFVIAKEANAYENIDSHINEPKWHDKETVPMNTGWYQVRRWPSSFNNSVLMQWNGRQWQGNEQVCKHQEFEWFGPAGESNLRPEHYPKADHVTVWTRIEDVTPTQKGFYEVFYTGQRVFHWQRAYWNGKSFVERPGKPKIPTLELFWRGLDKNPNPESEQ